MRVRQAGSGSSGWFNRVEPWVLPQLSQLAGSVFRLGEQQFTILFVLSFQVTLSLTEYRQRAVDGSA